MSTTAQMIPAAEALLLQSLVSPIVTGIRRRLARVAEARKRADQSVEAGREFVEAYVNYVHYVESIHLLATGSAPAHGEAHAGKSTGAADHK